MKLSSKNIKAGTFYTAKDGEVREVVSLEPTGMVTYDARKKTEAGGWSQARRYSETLDHFVRKVVAEAPGSNL